MTGFTTIDIVIVVIYMMVLIGVGIWTARKTKTTEDFMVAGRSIGIWRFTAAMAACVIGGSLTMGSSTLAYNFGVGAIWLGGICALSIFLLSLFLKTKLSNMRILSAAEGFGVFYGPYARVLSAVVMMIYMFMVGVVQVVAVGTILNVMFGWSAQISMLSGGIVVLAYIVIGGMWAVTYTDIIQFLIMTLGVCIICPRSGRCQNRRLHSPVHTRLPGGAGYLAESIYSEESQHCQTRYSPGGPVHFPLYGGADHHRHLPGDCNTGSGESGPGLCDSHHHIHPHRRAGCDHGSGHGGRYVYGLQ